MWPLWWPKSSAATTSAPSAASTAVRPEDESVSGTTAAAGSTKSLVPSFSKCHCCCLVTKLMKKLKRNRKALRPGVDNPPSNVVMIH
ncbi:hypothetical protein L6164_016982 [Bauhinia variegata]|uniref:Uncharacterized protein n=1 Tax=Bauhinia variegata TaxID=167791 RepID=A0ACB9NA31_BAUVA|nr:hypothetical protein L6164_016982 [Bauhinia variegata]